MSSSPPLQTGPPQDNAKDAIEASHDNNSSPYRYSEDFHRQRLGALLTRHGTTSIQIEDQPLESDVSADEVSVTPNHEARREGFTWDLPPASDTLPIANRNPVPPKAGTETPPLLEDVLRGTTNADADSMQNASRASTFADNTWSFLSRTGTNDPTNLALTRVDTSRSSIVGFAQGIARRVPDLRIFPPQEKSASQPHRARRDSQVPDLSNSDRRDRKLSFILPSSFKLNSSIERDQTPATLEAAEHMAKNSLCGNQKNGLRDRRKVNLDLELPIPMPELPARSRVAIDNLSSITPSRPRSPKTPWMRNETPKWHREGFSMSAPITEEDYIGQTVMNSGHMGILPGSDPISSSWSPELENMQRKGRDRCYISRPQHKRNRSARSGTSESSLARTPDGYWTPEETKIQRQQEVKTIAQLQELGKTSRSSRARKWRFTSPFSSTNRSSDETPLASPLSTRRRFSINPFKRAPRIGDECEHTRRRPQSPSSWNMRVSKDVLSGRAQQSSLSNMPVPPIFIPPGLSRVPTPPTLDDNGEIKGKLADFFFDHSAGVGRRRPKASPGGHWDSDALLMSFPSTDVNQNDEDSEEGPEGPIVPTETSLATPMSHRLNHGTPGLVSTPSGYLTAKGQYAAAPESPLPSTNDVWFRIQQDEMLDESTLTSLALREEEERRKFEWLIPEHLPNSPLCPLHAKYRGYSKEICLWHGRRTTKSTGNSRKSGETIRFRSSQEQDRSYQHSSSKMTSMNNKGSVGRAAPPVSPKPEVKKRRLASLSSP